MSSSAEQTDDDQQGTSSEAGLTKSLLASWSSWDDNDKIGDKNNSVNNYGAINNNINRDTSKPKRVDEATSSSSSNGNSGSGSGSGSGSDSNDNRVTYMWLLRTNQNFRYFWLSYVVNRMVSSL